MRWERPVDEPWQSPKTLAAAAEEVSLRVAILLLPPISLGTLAAVVDPLAEANRIGRRRYYDIVLASTDGAAVRLANGSRLAVDLALPAIFPCQALIVASDAHLPDDDEDAVLAQLARLQRFGTAFGATRGGTGWLASAGLLDERRVAVHWEEMALYRERFPKLIHCSSLYEVDADRFTASSGQAALDMMLFLVAQQTSPQLADDIARQLGLDRIRPGHEKQSVPASSRISQHPAKLSEALLVMEANLEEPLTSDEIAGCVGVSRRQLERLFKQSLQTLPSKYYHVLRLERAHQLIGRTSKSIVQIGLSCGFSSGSHFATAYRAHFGISPREERSRATLAGSVASHASANTAANAHTPTEPEC